MELLYSGTSIQWTLWDKLFLFLVIESSLLLTSITGKCAIDSPKLVLYMKAFCIYCVLSYKKYYLVCNCSDSLTQLVLHDSDDEELFLSTQPLLHSITCTMMKGMPKP